jgi:hypothetical protein
MIELRKAAQAAELRWETQQPALRREIEIREKHARKLERQLAAKKQALAANSKELIDLEAAVRKHRNALEALAASVATGDAVLRKLRPRLPPCLAEPLKPAFAELAASQHDASPEALGRRLQQLFSLFAEIENFDNGVHVCRQVLAPPTGGEREMDVLYLGLGAAYAVSSGGKTAAVGRPGPAGWEWQWDAAPAAAIQRAVALYRKERSAGFVDLPLAIHGDGER